MVSAGLLMLSSVSRIRDGMSLLPPVTMLVLCGVVWFF